MLAQRVERLERQNRRLRHGLFLLVAAVLVVGIMPAQQDVVRARQFRVVDSMGRDRIALYSVEGMTAISIADEAGKPVVTIGSGGGETGIFITKAGEPLIKLTADSRYASLVLHEVLGKRRPMVVLEATPLAKSIEHEHTNPELVTSVGQLTIGGWDSSYPRSTCSFAYRGTSGLLGMACPTLRGH